MYFLVNTSPPKRFDVATSTENKNRHQRNTHAYPINDTNSWIWSSSLREDSTMATFTHTLLKSSGITIVLEASNNEL